MEALLKIFDYMWFLNCTFLTLIFYRPRGKESTEVWINILKVASFFVEQLKCHQYVFNSTFRISVFYKYMKSQILNNFILKTSLSQ